MSDLAAIAAEFGDDPEPRASTFVHHGTVWRWQSPGDAVAIWYFLVIDGPTADALRAAAGPRRGFGSVKVEAEIGSTRFATSLFPSREQGGFLLPLKASVRKAEGLAEGSALTATLTLV